MVVQCSTNTNFNSLIVDTFSRLLHFQTTCELPYYEYVGSDPSFDDMQSVVVAKVTIYSKRINL